jgi:hypothetical protein
VSDAPRKPAGIFLRWGLLLACLYALCGGIAAWQTVQLTNASTGILDQIMAEQSLGNASAQAVAHFRNQHQIVGSFVVSYLKGHSSLPSLKDSNLALAETTYLKGALALENARATLWSRILFGVSLLYLALAAAPGGEDRLRRFLFALTGVSAMVFVVGISASAMMIFTTINDFFGATPVIQHETRSVYSVISGLFQTGHWIFAGFITLFSIATPTMKISLTFIAATTASQTRNAKVSKFLNAIGKWSMADVFVAAVLLACFTIKSAGGTQVIPFRGLYYFAGYCLLSMVTTSVLHSLSFEKGSKYLDTEGQIRIPAAAELVGALLFFASIIDLRK